MKNFLKKLAAVIVTSATLVFSVAYAPQAHNDYLRWKTEDSIVKVLNYGIGGGTGFSIKGKSGKSYIMTNKHVCFGAANNVVGIQNKNEAAILKNIVHIDNEHDLCLIEGDEKFPALSLGSDLRIGEFNYIVGHPGGRDLTVFSGEYTGNKNVRILDSIKNKEDCVGELYIFEGIMQFIYGMEFACIRTYESLGLTTNSYPGNSGSPVLNKFGNVVGVLFAGSNSEERDNSAVPLNEVQRVLEQF